MVSGFSVSIVLYVQEGAVNDKGLLIYLFIYLQKESRKRERGLERKREKENLK